MGYWKKPQKYHCKKECKPYLQVYNTEKQYVHKGSVVKFDECGPECGFEECRNDIIVQHEGVYFVSFEENDDVKLVITVNGVPQNNTTHGNGLLCLKCGDKIRLIVARTSYGCPASEDEAQELRVGLKTSLTLFKVN